MRGLLTWERRLRKKKWRFRQILFSGLRSSRSSVADGLRWQNRLVMAFRCTNRNCWFPFQKVVVSQSKLQKRLWVERAEMLKSAAFIPETWWQIRQFTVKVLWQTRLLVLRGKRGEQIRPEKKSNKYKICGIMDERHQNGSLSNGLRRHKKCPIIWN